MLWLFAHALAFRTLVGRVPASSRWPAEAARGRPFAPFDQRFHLILNLAVGGHLAEGRNVGGVRVEAFPQQFIVDWVRVYDCPQDLETAQACVN